MQAKIFADTHDRSAAPCFNNDGGYWRLQLTEPAHLRYLLDMDVALWAVSSCPLSGLYFDAATLRFLDADGDRRIRYEELRAAIRWYLDVLKAPPPAGDSGETLALDEINAGTPEGGVVHAAAVRILDNIGRGESDTLDLATVMDRKRVISAAGSNGDGVITPASVADDPSLASAVTDIITTLGAVSDINGEAGVNAERVTTFYQALRDYLTWCRQGWTPDTSLTPNLSAFAPESLPDAATAWKAVREKITEYFELSRMARFDGRATVAANLRDSEWSGLSGRSAEEIRGLLTGAPLAPVTGADTLDFNGRMNPVYAPALTRFHELVWSVLFPGHPDVMSESQWRLVQRLFDGFEQRFAARRGSAVESLGIERVQTLLDEDARDTLLARIAHDAAAAADINAIEQVEKLILFKQHLLAFANNFVAFPDFYDFNCKASFEMGTLVMDGRRFTLCVHTDNPAEHAVIAKRAGIYLLYCELSRIDVADKRRVAVAVTAGGTGMLFAGKRGVFRDREGRDWDARVTAIIENPISLSEAMWAPFKRLGAVITSQFEKLTTAREKTIEQGFNAGFTQVAQAVDAGPAVTPPAAGSPAAAKPVLGGYGGMVVGGSVAVAALGSSFAFISKTFTEIGRINIVYTAAVILMIILMPTLILAFLRLRARDIGKMLEACGWAVNGRMRLTMRLARILSYTPELPSGARKCGLLPDNAPAWLQTPARSRRRLRLLLALLFATLAFCLIQRFLGS